MAVGAAEDGAAAGGGDGRGDGEALAGEEAAAPSRDS